MPHTPLPPFSGWSGPRHPRILLVGEAWGESEERLRGKPLAGESGKEMWRILGEAWPEISPSEHSRVTSLHKYDLAWVGQREAWMAEAGVSYTNVLALRPPQNKLEALSVSKKELGGWAGYDLPAISKGLYLRPEIAYPELARLEEEISEARPNLCVALGNTASWALLRATNITQIRGTTSLGGLGSTQVKVLPTFHPAAVLRMWAWRVIVVADMMKALREAQHPEIIRPERSILISPTLPEVRQWVSETLSSPPGLLACDTETSLGIIDTIGFARSPGEALVCQIGPHRSKVGQRFVTVWPQRGDRSVASYWSEEEEFQFWELCGLLLESEAVVKVFQNGMYDLQYLLRQGLRPRACLEDTMLLSHALYPEMQKSLGFLGSIYSNEPAWKLMRRHRTGDSEKREE